MGDLRELINLPRVEGGINIAESSEVERAGYDIIDIGK